MFRLRRTKRWEGLFVCVIAVALAEWCVARAAGRGSPEDIRARLAALLAKAPKGAQIGLMAVDCETGEVWFESGAKLPLKPASVMKLFTTAAALERFGPDFALRTRVYVNENELLLVGGGDPGLGDERLAQWRGAPRHNEFDAWARLLQQRGATRIDTIALDDSIFDQEYRHPDWPDDQQSAWYQAPVGGINFNDNCLDAALHIRDGKPELTLSPRLPEGFVRNRLRVGEKHAPAVARVPGQDIFDFTGTAKRDDSFRACSVGQPTVFFGYALREALRQDGIEVADAVVRRKIEGNLPAGAELLDTRTTKLEEILKRCNTNSQNLFAECLLKSLAAYNPDGTRGDVAGSWTAGVGVLETTLRGMGIDVSDAIFRDGSGLSHTNRVTAAQIVALLRHMHQSPHAAFFKASLARPGEEGTLRSKRWRGPKLQDRLWAKTGTIQGVSALAGYVRRADGHELAFALLVNGVAGDPLRLPVAEILADAGGQ